MRIGIFVDTGNLFYSVHAKFPQRKLNYEIFFEEIKESDTVTAIAYGKNFVKNIPFQTCLQHIGFTTKFTDFVFAMDIALDIIEMLPRLDKVILGTSSMAFAPLVKYIASKGVAVHVVSANIPNELVNYANEIIEIEEGDLEEEKSNSDDDSQGNEARDKATSEMGAE